MSAINWINTQKSGLQPGKGQMVTHQNTVHECHVSKQERRTWTGVADMSRQQVATLPSLPRDLIPVTAVIQANKRTCLVLDYQELKNMLTLTDLMPIHEGRSWGSDNKKCPMFPFLSCGRLTCKYMSLWPFQTVLFKMQRYCLTSMKFELNMVPAIMNAFNRQHQHA